MTSVRRNRSSRIDRRRLALEVRRSRRSFLVVLVGLALAGTMAAFIFTKVSRTAFAETRTLAFAVDDATGVLANSDEVRFKGIPAGAITKVEMQDGGPVVTVKLKKSYGEIYRNARAEIRPTTPLQDMYLNIIDRGTTSAGPADADTPIASGQTRTSVNVDDVLNVFRADQRTRLRTVLDGFGRGLEGRGAVLREAFVAAVPFLKQADDLTGKLAAQRSIVRRLVHNTAVLTLELGGRQTMLRELVRSGNETLSTLSNDSNELDATLEELPLTLTALDSSLSAVRGVVDEVDPALRSLRTVAGQLPTGLSALRRLSTTAAPAVKALQRPVDELAPVVRDLDPLSANLRRSVDLLEPQAPTVNKVTDVLVKCKTGVQHFFQWNTSIAKFGDALGPFPRGNLVIGAASSSLGNTPDEHLLTSCDGDRAVGGRPLTASDLK